MSKLKRELIRCWVPDCANSKKSKNPNDGYFRFPVKNVERCRKWLKAVAWEELIYVAPQGLCNRYVCGLHFQPKEMFKHPKRLSLQPDAVPSIFNPIRAPLPDELVNQYPWRDDDSCNSIAVNPGSVKKLCLLSQPKFEQIPFASSAPPKADNSEVPMGIGSLAEVQPNNVPSLLGHFSASMIDPPSEVNYSVDAKPSPLTVLQSPQSSNSVSVNEYVFSTDDQPSFLLDDDVLTECSEVSLLSAANLSSDEWELCGLLVRSKIDGKVHTAQLPHDTQLKGISLLKCPETQQSYGE